MKEQKHISILQKHIRDIYGQHITIDGIVGPETRTVLRRVIYREFERRGWSLEHVRNNKTELVWLRYDRTYNNAFNDYLVVFDHGEVIHILKATTTPGNYYVNNPVTVGGITGTGSMVEQQVIASHKWVENNDWSTLWLGTPYAKQIGNIKIYRDRKKDMTYDRDFITVGKSWYGFNMHQMGAGTINWNWSAGCLGTSRTDWLLVVNRLDDGDIINLNLIEI